MTSNSYEALKDEIAAKLGVKLRRHTSLKACGPCPECGGNDRLVVWVYEQSAWCSRCGFKSFLGDDPGEAKREAMAKKIEQQRQIDAIRGSISVSVEWIEYNSYAKQHPELWAREGMTEQDIAKWGLGYTDVCPALPTSRSLTIPVFKGDALVDIRHKLLDVTEDTGKYRSHHPMLTPIPFNMGVIYSTETVYIVEGEKKAIHMDRHGFTSTTGIPGINTSEVLLKELSRQDVTISDKYIVCFDPGAAPKAEALAKAILDTRPTAAVYVADFFDKPDDILQHYGRSVVEAIISQARRMYNETTKQHRRK